MPMEVYLQLCVCVWNEDANKKIKKQDTVLSKAKQSTDPPHIPTHTHKHTLIVVYHDHQRRRHQRRVRMACLAGECQDCGVAAGSESLTPTFQKKKEKKKIIRRPHHTVHCVPGVWNSSDRNRDSNLLAHKAAPTTSVVPIRRDGTGLGVFAGARQFQRPASRRATRPSRSSHDVMDAQGLLVSTINNGDVFFPPPAAPLSR